MFHTIKSVPETTTFDKDLKSGNTVRIDFGISYEYEVVSAAKGVLILRNKLEASDIVVTTDLESFKSTTNGNLDAACVEAVTKTGTKTNYRNVKKVDGRYVYEMTKIENVRKPQPINVGYAIEIQTNLGHDSVWSVCVVVAQNKSQLVVSFDDQFLTFTESTKTKVYNSTTEYYLEDIYYSASVEFENNPK